jgi:hypothetical protein
MSGSEYKLPHRLSDSVRADQCRGIRELLVTAYVERKKNVQLWVTGSGIMEAVLTLNDAIALARKHRDQLIAGARLLEELPASKRLSSTSMTSANVSWVHYCLHWLDSHARKGLVAILETWTLRSNHF